MKVKLVDVAQELKTPATKKIIVNDVEIGDCKPEFYASTNTLVWRAVIHPDKFETSPTGIGRSGMRILIGEGESPAFAILDAVEKGLSACELDQRVVFKLAESLAVDKYLACEYNPKLGSKENIIVRILSERKNQDRQWGGPRHDDQHNFDEWCQFILKQLNAAMSEKGGTALQASRMVRVAALAMASIESMARKASMEVLSDRKE